MSTAEASAVIARPISVVWDYCSAAENLAVYLPGTIEVHALTEGRTAVGTQWAGSTRFLGPSMSWRGEFVTAELNHLLVFDSIEAPFCFTTVSTFDEVDGGTRFTYRMDTESGLGGIFGKLAEPVVVKAYTRALRSSLENLVDVLV
jgi:uncharacterized protein YndB with AHSA1/START domain